jgi:DNA-binding MarR family transcriptional regulator
MTSLQWHTMMRETGARARNTDPRTSDLAAATVPCNRLEEVCLRHLRFWPEGLTSEGLSDSTGLSVVTASPRLKRLEEKGHVYRDGTRANRSGKQAIVWKAVPIQGRLL